MKRQRLIDNWRAWKERWESGCASAVYDLMQKADPGHDVAHVRRVLVNAERIGSTEQADPCVVLAAVWFHDCVCVPKNSPQRRQASRLAADQAILALKDLHYPPEHFPAIEHAILSHSFSAGIAPETIEAKVVQDADRLEALGAIGLARCLMTGGALGQQLVHASEPFPIERAAVDSQYSVDHFFAKLLGLHTTMQTITGREEARRRTAFLHLFLKELADELQISESQLRQAYARFNFS